MNNVRVRFAPSPTGFLHIGGARTALYNWLFAKKNKGKFILRIEDTDIERSTEESIGAILDGMRWLGLDWDEGPEVGGDFGPYFQSERTSIYQEYINKLLKEGKAYRCFCSQEDIEKEREIAEKEKRPYRYSGKCRNLSDAEIEKHLSNDDSFTIRLKLDDNEDDIILNDIVRGEINFDKSHYDDFIIVRSNGLPVYNFAVVIDDALMNINYVIRGDDHISNTPRQIFIYKALGFPVPKFAHLPMILGEDKTRLSKRHGATSVQQFRDMGYLSEAMINYLVRLGWGYDDTQEIFEIDDLIEKFSLERVGKNPSIFNFKKLEWINNYYIGQLPIEKRTKESIPFLIKAGLIDENYVKNNLEILKRIVEIIGSRLRTLNDIIFYSEFFFKDKVEYSEDAVNKIFKKYELINVFDKIIDGLKNIDLWNKENLIEKLESLSGETELNKRIFFQAIRAAITGKLISPDLIDIMLIMKKDMVIKRLDDALNFMKDIKDASGN